MPRTRREGAGGLTIHPLLFGAFPILSLIGYNIIEIAPEDGLRTLLISVSLAGIVWLLARAITRWTWGRSGLVASLFASLFFSYGHVYAFLEGANVLGVRVGRHLLLAPLGFGIFTAGLWGIRRIRDTATLNRMLNLIGFALLVIPLYQISAHEVILMASQTRGENPALNQAGNPGAPQPDIYYIILDAYARDDVLLEVFDYDNTPFLEALEERGFVIPRCTRSNYGRTYLSVSSSLNMGYVQDFEPNGPGDLTAAIKDSAVRRTLADQGYSVVAFDPGFFRTQWPDADLYFSYEDRRGGLGTINDFEAMVVDTTALFFFLDANTALGGSSLESIYRARRLEKFNRVNYIFDTLETVPEVAESPKFVWVHVPSPHGPYVFTESGGFYLLPENTPERYRDQVVYLNQRILAIVDQILASSDLPPIIVIQGDHGASETKPDFRRLNILNAYHLPGEEHTPLHPTMTPVNTFRLIFDSYFGEDLGLLPDVSYFSPIGNDYAFVRAPDSRPGCEGFDRPG